MNTARKRISPIAALAATAAALLLAISLSPPSSAHGAQPSEDPHPLQTSVSAQASKTKIRKADVRAATLKYTGKAQNADVTVSVGGNLLVRGRDYSLSIKNAKGKKASKPKKAGTYKAIVKGKGAYKGTVTKKFKVYSKDGKRWVNTFRWVKQPYDEQVVDQPAWTEFVYRTERYIKCGGCGIEHIDSGDIDENAYWIGTVHPQESPGCLGKNWMGLSRQVLVGTVEHPATYKTVTRFRFVREDYGTWV